MTIWTSEIAINFFPRGLNHSALLKRKDCYKLEWFVDKVSGANMINGLLEGTATLLFHDQTRMKAYFHQGIITGQVLIFDKHDNVRGFGLYENGLPHGPFWFVYEYQFMQVLFFGGEMFEDRIVLVDTENNSVVTGKLTDGSRLVDIFNVEVSFGDLKGIKVAQITKKLQRRKDLKLPLRIIAAPMEQRIIIKPAKILYFLRVAKTGSLSVMHLLGQLGLKLDYEVVKSQSPLFEILTDNPSGISKEVGKLISTHNNIAYCRHYSFIDFKTYGYPWMPDWFSLVRHPIEKVWSENEYNITLKLD